MSKANTIGCLVMVACLTVAGCHDGGPADPGSGGGRQEASQNAADDPTGQLTGKLKGLRDAKHDLAKGILKLKEYPPLPYSLTDIRYIRLLKKRCGVEHEVLGPPGKEQDLRAEAQAYNSVMTTAIRQKYGADILSKLRQEADRR